MRRVVRTVGEFIDAFGGPTQLAGAFGVGRTAVNNWQARDTIPACWHLRLIAEARRRHITIDPQVLGLSNEDAAVLGPVMNCQKRKAAKAAA